MLTWSVWLVATEAPHNGVHKSYTQSYTLVYWLHSKSLSAAIHSVLPAKPPDNFLNLHCTHCIKCPIAEESWQEAQLATKAAWGAEHALRQCILTGKRFWFFFTRHLHIMQPYGHNVEQTWLATQSEGCDESDPQQSRTMSTSVRASRVPGRLM